MAMENGLDPNDGTREEPQQDDASSCSSDGSSIGVPLYTTNQQQEAKPELPSEGLQWKDDAIRDCFQLALSTHDYRYEDEDEDNKNNNNKGGSSSCSWSVPPLGNAQDNEFLASWRPRSLPLPLWAVDPLVQSS
jgi:hypothetical protein